jgi:hypothetical protein
MGCEEVANDTVQLNILLKIQYHEMTTVPLVFYAQFCVGIPAN